MASIGSLTSSTSNSIRGYGGLASGLDRDELIQGMTIGTTSKLNQQEQKKQKIEWMQEAVRTISDKMISFHGKYTETLTSSSNLFSSMLWGRNKITTTGTNSKYVSVSGTASSADAMTIMGIKQKAQNASISTKDMASDRTLSSAKIDATATYATLADKNLVFSVNDKDYVITLDEASLKDKAGNVTAASVAAAINTKLETAKNGDNTEDISSYFEVTAEGNGFKITATGADAERAENKTKLRGGTALEFMGIENKEVDFSDTENIVSEVGSTKPIKLTKSFEEMVKGQTLTFSYNGTSQQIAIENAADLDQVKNSLQKSLDAKFGEGRIAVAVKDGKLTFKTTVPGGGGEDTSSTLKLTGGSADAIKALGLSVGSSNRVNMDAKLSDFGFEKVAITPTEDEDGKPVEQEGYKIQINGTTIEMNENATVKDLMNAINKSDANVTVSYQEAADKFTFTSTVDGASGVIQFKGNGDGAEGTNLAALKKLFGIDVKADEEVRGKDAIVAVKYAGAEEPVELRRGTNSFTVDGLTINVKGEFGYKTVKDENGKDVKELDPAAEAVEVDASVDVDRLMSTIKSFVEDYNSIVDLVNGELTTKHDSDYDPLTSDQKEELSESEITKWETKAKEGLLYGDSDLRSLSMDLRVVVSGGLLVQFEKVGISLSSNYSDNGKLSIDETKLRAALETNPESVEKLFTSKAGVDADGNETFNGLATNLKNVMDKYVKTTGSMEDKGILIRKAGSKSAAMSLTQNTYYDQLTSIDKLIATLQARLKTEQDRYISQFSTLETMIANMNSQASYLSSM